MENADLMFFRCSKLTTLNLSNFNTRSIQTSSGLFEDCNKLITIIVGENWDESVFEGGSLFTGCTALVGGAGTTYNSNHVSEDYIYAHIDGGASNPGYLTSMWKCVKRDTLDFEPNVLKI